MSDGITMYFKFVFPLLQAKLSLFICLHIVCVAFVVYSLFYSLSSFLMVVLFILDLFEFCMLEISAPYP